MANENMQVVAAEGSREGTRVITLKGPLTLQTLFQFQNAVRAETAPVVIIDFTDVPFVDSAGLGALVGAHVTAQKNKRAIYFTGFNPKVKALIEMTHIGQFFRTFATVQDAEAVAS
jgi:anti-anti-sigma factor